MNHSTEHAERETVPRLLFGRHHGYDLREQWISKGLLALAHAENAPARARLFAFPEASDRFGLGPGMVAALRYWLRTTGLMIEQQPGSAHGRLVPTLTPLGALLARYDPYLEQVGSLWLLHAHLTTNLLLAPTFYWFFQSFVGTLPFTKEACLDALLSWAIKDAPGQHINSDVLRKDLECLFRLYTSGSRAPQASPEQSLIASPFRRLRLLQCLPPPESGSLAGKPTRRDLPRYVLYPPQTGDIPALIVLALVLKENAHVAQVSLTHLLYRQQQIGRICGVKRDTLVEIFQQISTHEPSWSPRPIKFKEQVWFQLPAVTAEQVLLRYYAQPS